MRHASAPVACESRQLVSTRRHVRCGCVRTRSSCPATGASAAAASCAARNELIVHSQPRKRPLPFRLTWTCTGATRSPPGSASATAAASPPISAATRASLAASPSRPAPPRSRFIAPARKGERPTPWGARAVPTPSPPPPLPSSAPAPPPPPLRAIALARSRAPGGTAPTPTVPWNGTMMNALVGTRFGIDPLTAPAGLEDPRAPAGHPAIIIGFKV